jgi:Holliday junction resolvase RusA-like endonuclease
MTKGGAGEERPKESIASLPSSISKTWKVPFLPPSMNKIYGINFQKRSVYMMPEARTFKSQAKMCIGNFPTSKNDKLSLSLSVHTDWYFKNGNLRKADIQNLIKVVVDAVSERLGFDDAQVFSFSANKIQSTENYCTVTLEKQNEEIIHVEKA